MKKIYLLVLFFSCLGFSQTENFPYERDWASYMFTPLQQYNSDGSLVGYSTYLNFEGFPELYNYLNPQDTIGHFYLTKITAEGTIDYIRKFGGTGGTINDVNYYKQIVTDPNKNVYISGITDHPFNIGTIGTHQPNFNNNVSLPEPFVINDSTTIIIPPQSCTDGFLIKLDSLGNKVWGTYFNGDQSVSGLKVETKNNFLYIQGHTSSNNNLTTPNSFFPNSPDTLYLNKIRPFIARINPENGQLLWASYTPDWLEDEVFDFEAFAINSLGDIYVANEGNNIIKKISADGTQVLGSYEIPEVQSITDLFIDNTDQLIVGGYTNLSTGVATPGAFLTTKTYPNEFCLLKFNSGMQKTWGTYIGQTNDVSIYFDDRKDNLYFGVSTNIAQLATIGAYQEQINGEKDLLILKLNANGQLVWSTYYGGEGMEFGGKEVLAVTVDNNENLFFKSATSSQNSIVTEDATFPNLIPTNPFINTSYFAVRFNKTTTANTNNNETIPYLIYPNPVQDILNIQSPILFDTDSEFKIYDLNGKLVHSQKGEYANVNVLFLSHFAAGTYVIEINHQGKKQTQKFIKK